MCAHSLQSCLTLCNSMDCSPPGSAVHGIFLTRILEWVAMLSSRGSSQPRDQICISCACALHVGSLPTELSGKPSTMIKGPKFLHISPQAPKSLRKRRSQKCRDLSSLVNLLEGNSLKQLHVDSQFFPLPCSVLAHPSWADLQQCWAAIEKGWGL